MRTTVRLDDQLLRQAKMLAAASGKTLTAVIEEALREAIARRLSPPPRVDLDNAAALLELMEAAPV